MQVNKQSITIIREWIRDNDLGKHFVVKRDQQNWSCLYVNYLQLNIMMAHKGYDFREWITGYYQLPSIDQRTFIIRSKHDVKEMMVHSLTIINSDCLTPNLRLKVLLEVVKNAK